MYILSLIHTKINEAKPIYQIDNHTEEIIYLLNLVF